jgi:glyoxylase-like metal-dependent hydrolase (beta-lactamase superfamily II)
VDCFLLEFGEETDPRYILVDGGPGTIYEPHLKPVLTSIAGQGGGLDLIVVSHVDRDHVLGLLDLMADLRTDRESGRTEFIGVDGIWHNAFDESIDPTGEV